MASLARVQTIEHGMLQHVLRGTAEALRHKLPAGEPGLCPRRNSIGTRSQRTRTRDKAAASETMNRAVSIWGPYRPGDTRRNEVAHIRQPLWRHTGCMSSLESALQILDLLGPDRPVLRVGEVCRLLDPSPEVVAEAERFFRMAHGLP